MTRWLALLAAAVATAAGLGRVVRAGREGPTAATPTTFDLSQARIVDLTHAFEARTPYWPTATTGFQLTAVHRGWTSEGFFYSAFSFCAPEHGGTHLDAPFHFAEGGRPADAVPLRQLLAPAVVVDVTAQAGRDPDYRLTAADVRAFEEKHGRIAPGAIVLLRTGWSARWPDRKRYLGDDTPGDASRLHFPAYGKEAAELLVRERKAGALGVDTASLDHGPSRDFIVHQIAAAANVPGLENLTGLGELPPVGAFVVALPMKIAGGSGGPLRAIALLPGP
jgi:kynurenine formamidase